MNTIDDDEMVTLFDAKDIQALNTGKKDDYEADVIESDTDALEIVKNGSICSNGSCTERRSDEPTELSFEKGDEITMKLICVESDCRAITTESSHSNRFRLASVLCCVRIACAIESSAITFFVVVLVFVIVSLAHISRYSDSAEFVW